MDSTSDNALAERLRREDLEQYHTLVRMHLSFVLDLNTDDLSVCDASATHCPGNMLHVLSSIWRDAYGCMQLLRSSQSHQHGSIVEQECCDCASEKAKIRLLQKWSFVPFSKKGKCTSKGVMEGAPLTQEGICQVYQLIEFLGKEENICQEGIFRRTGKLTRQQELKSLLNQGVPLNLDDGLYSVHDCASVLKNFLAELPESLLTDAHYPAYCQIAEMCENLSGSTEQSSCQSNENRLLRALQLLFLLLPSENRILLRDILQLLHKTASYESRNKMSADSLATLFTPHLLCPRKLTPEAMHLNSQTMSGVVAFMIHKGSELFNIPPKLATDIRAYFVEREKRKLSPKKQLNESVCDSTAANTVFTFVDRERTAQAHITNPTEAALAQLYAHIQSLPESSKKKKLIKQFNKENGQGTPLQSDVRRKNHLRSKSLGDSIKKHIFNKGIKRPKNLNGEAHFNVSRSLSQETINKPGSCIRLFQKSMEEDSFTLIQQEEMHGTFKPINSASCVLVQLKNSANNNSKTERSLIFSESKDPLTKETDDSRRAILQNLASQVAVNHQKGETNELCSDSILGSRKRTTSSSNTCECDSSPPKILCSSEDLKPSPPLVPSIPEQPAPVPSSEDKGTEAWPVNKCAVALTPSCCDHSIFDSPVALPGFFSPPPVLGTSNRLTPRNALTCLLTTSTPASQSRLRMSSSARGPLDVNHGNCLLTPIADENNSMSPITRSTQKMPKAMQETMMTPRCRKPVVLVSGSNLCHLANLGTLESSHKRHCHEANNSIPILEDKASSSSRKEESPLENYKSAECSAAQLSSEDEKMNMDLEHQEPWTESNSDISDSGSLTSTFRSYLLNRSVLTASPVDLSFTSRTGDFDTSDSKDDSILERDSLSKSLLFCLDGNQPSTSSAPDEPDNDLCSSIEVKSDGAAKVTKECDTNSQSYDRTESDDEKPNKVQSASFFVLDLNDFDKNQVHETSL